MSRFRRAMNHGRRHANSWQRPDQSLGSRPSGGPRQGRRGREINMGRQPSAKPTSFDIAYLAGVSQPTVSRALRGSKSVSAATRANIERIARELNYTVDKNASRLDRKSTRLNYRH